jgi:hypothetical protein
MSDVSDFGVIEPVSDRFLGLGFVDCIITLGSRDIHVHVSS